MVANCVAQCLAGVKKTTNAVPLKSVHIQLLISATAGGVRKLIL